MSGIQRFDQAHWGMTMDDEHGDYVLYGDHKRKVDGLEAEIARLRAEADPLRVDAERWRHARKLLRADEIQAGAYSLACSGGLFDEAANVETDKAIDEAMGADA